MTRYIFLEEANDLSELRNTQTIRDGGSTSRERAIWLIVAYPKRSAGSVTGRQSAEKRTKVDHDSTRIESGEWQESLRLARHQGARCHTRRAISSGEPPRPRAGRPRDCPAARRIAVTTLVRPALFARLSLPSRRRAIFSRT